MARRSGRGSARGGAGRGRTVARSVAGRLSGALGALVLLSSLFGCDSAEVKACHAAMVTSQKSLLALQKEDRAQVEAVLLEVQGARDACVLAGRESETKKVADALRQLENLRDALEERATRVKKQPPSEAELKQLLHKGDPSCPRGEGYQLGSPPKMVKCTGKTMIEMSRPEVRAFLEADGYRILSDPTATTVRAEHGSKLFVIEYADPNAAPRCLRATPKPGVPWHETASRLTGVPQKKLEVGRDVSTPAGPKKLGVVGGGLQETVLLGDCSS